MGLPWEGKVQTGASGRAVDSVAKTLHLDTPILANPIIGKTASDFVAKTLPYKGVILAGLIVAPIAAVAGPSAAAALTLGGVLSVAVKAKRWAATRPVAPLLRSLG